MAGRGVRPGIPELDRLVGEGGLEGAVHMLGSRADAPAVLAALDAFVMPSTFGEGFPNVLGEAMASGVPCVTTDVGDAAVVVGDLGSVVERGRPGALARAVLDLLGMSAEDRTGLGSRCRASIGERFALEAVAGRYADLYGYDPA
jgi:glycosyltransferase involved in cell wall biosynthesis